MSQGKEADQKAGQQDFYLVPLNIDKYTGNPVTRGEEIFLNYSYNMNNDPPEWYVRFYESIYGKVETNKTF